MELKEVEAVLQLSPAQEDVLRRVQGAGVPTGRLTCALEGALDVEAFAQAWEEVCRRHQLLRALLVSRRVTRPLLLVRRSAKPALTFEDWRGLPPAEQTHRIASVIADERTRGFELSTAPLLRLRLGRVADARWQLVLTYHQLILDRDSAALVWDEALSLYDDSVGGQSAPLAPAARYEDYAIWLKQQDASACESFHCQRLACEPARVMERTATDLARRASREGRLGAEALGALRELKRAGVALDTLLEGAWALLVSGHGGGPRIEVGVDLRVRSEDFADAALAGVFRHTLPLHADTAQGGTLLEWLRGLEAQKRELRRHAFCSVARLSELGCVSPDATPFETQVRVGAAPTSRARHASNLVVFDLRLEEETAHSLSLFADDEDDDLVLRIDYDPGAFEGANVEGMLRRLGALLKAIGSWPEQGLAEVRVLEEEEHRRIIDELSGERTEFPRERCIHELFEEQAARTPASIALSFQGGELTYGELDARANELARRLSTLGVGPEVAVGVLLERSPELIVTLLGVLKAGGAYLPLDPSYPAERLSFMLEDAAAPVLVTVERLLDVLPATWAQVVCLDDHAELPEATGEADPALVDVTPEGLAYVMYTSGSTGVPKGVAVTHRNVVRLVRGAGYAEFGPEQVFLQLAPISFDASTFEVWGPLLNGGRLALMPAGSTTLEELGAALARHRVTTLWLTAGLFHLMADERPEALAGLRQLLAGGDVLSPAHVNRVRASGGGPVVINGYGPTENTTFTCCWRADRDVPAGATVPVGRPVSNTRVYLLDGELRPVARGVVGEMYAGGEGVARGYVGRAGLTAERFVPDPYASGGGARMYRTGDMGRWQAGGEIEFLGRRDGQVKVRGFRVEVGEVEAALQRHPAVKRCVVVARGEGAEKHLVAYAVAEEDLAFTPVGLREHLRGRLPEHMIPTHFVALQELPLTPNGKVDRRALPESTAVIAGQTSDSYVAPRTPVEDLLASIWADVLDVKLVGARDNFFDLGGHSLLATQVVSRVRETFGIPLPIRLLFESPTVEALAAHLESERRGALEAAIPPLEPVPRDQTLPLSFAQQRLWFLDQLEPGNVAYNIPVGVRLSGRLDVAALEAALGGVVRRHEALRTSFAVDGGRPAQVVSPPGAFPLTLMDLRELPSAEREAEAQRLAAEEARRPFELARGPLLRALLWRLAEDEHLFLLTMHHIVSDAWSMGLLIREVTTLYEANIGGQPSALGELPIQYVDFAHWQRQWLRGEVLESQLAYWRRKLGGELPVLSLPSEGPGGSARGASHNFHLSAQLAEALRSLSRKEGATLFMTLLAAFKVLLGHHARREDIVVGSPVAGRTRAEVEPLIGFFVNTLVLRTDLSGDPTFAELLGRVRETTLDAYAHQEVPFERLVEELKPDRAAADSPLFQVAFTLDNTRHTAVELPGLTLAPWPIESGATRYGFIAALADVGAEGIAGSLQYDARLFSAADVARLSAHYLLVLEGVAADPEARLSELAAILEDADRRRAEARRHEFREARGRRLREAKSKDQKTAHGELVK